MYSAMAGWRIGLRPSILYAGICPLTGLGGESGANGELDSRGVNRGSRVSAGANNART